MNAAPIIHTRTLNNDFLSGFLVRPDYFTSEDIEWARKMIRASTADIDLMKGERYVVLDNGSIRIAGIVSVTSDLALKAKSNIDNRFFLDKQGRNIYAFIGVCFNSGDRHNVVLSYDEYMKIFEEYVIPVFEDKVVDTQLVSDTIILNQGVTVNPPEDQGFRLNKCTIYESTIETDKQWFNYYLACRKKEFSFCSNVSKYQTLKDSIFDYITTTPNNIKRLQKDMPEINFIAKQQEEAAYQEFKEKYHERLLQEFESEMRQKYMNDPSFIAEIRDSSQTTDYVLERLFQGDITETSRFIIYELSLKLNSYHAAGACRIQKPISIGKKEGAL